METKPEVMNKLFTHQMEHRYGGNGFGVVQTLPDNYCRVTDLGPKNIGKQFFLAYMPMLSVEQRQVMDAFKKPTGIWIDHEISPELLEVLTPIREALKSGKAKVVNTRLVTVKK
jgi:hypothetical protein